MSQNIQIAITNAQPPLGAAPFYGRSVQQDLVLALSADEAALFGAGTVNNGTNSDIFTTALAAPSGLTVTAQGTQGSTSYSYVIADVSNAGTLSPCTAVTNSLGNATLTAANSLLLSWTGIVGHTYNIYRSASAGTPSGLGLIGTLTVAAPANSNSVYNNTLGFPWLTATESPAVNVQGANPQGVQTTVTQTFTDTGIVATTVDVPTVNTTGSIVAAGPIYGSGVVLSGGGQIALTSTAAMTYTVANMQAGIILRSGQSASTADLTPSAAQLVGGFPGVKVNQYFKFLRRNGAAFQVTLTGSTGVTVSGALVANSSIREFTTVFLNVTPGTESVTIYGGAVTAY